VLLDCVIYCAFYSILFRGAVFSGHGITMEKYFMSESSGLSCVLDDGLGIYTLDY